MESPIDFDSQDMNYPQPQEAIWTGQGKPPKGALTTGKEQAAYSLPTAKRECLLQRQPDLSAQNMPKPIFTIMPDFGGAYGWRKDNIDNTGVGGSHADTSGWCDDIGISVSLHERFAAWQAEFESAGMSSRDFADFDWVEFHHRGILLSHQLKAELGEQAVIIYEKAFEDPCHHDAERREILAGGGVRILPSR